jgi:F5/8 type C domain
MVNKGNKIQSILFIVFIIQIQTLYNFPCTSHSDNSTNIKNAFAYTINESNQKKWFANSKYGINIAFFPEAYPELKGKDLSDGTWDKMVTNFDVNTFAKDVVKTGAKYVIFSAGQTSGYYTSPSLTFMQATNTKLGEYAPKRDLVKDIAVKLKEYNIPTLVYVGVEGPIIAPPKITSTFPAINDQADLANRKTFNAMIREWSLRWKNNVSGWWLDGCYPWVAGLNNTPAGEKNVDALIDATKVGNKNAISTCNPSIGIFKATSSKQDFMAGEEAYFHHYPRKQFMSGKKEIQWHIMSFLGEDWSRLGTSRYNKRYLAEYIRGVNHNGGVVTIDMAVMPNGRIDKDQMSQMSYVKDVVRNHKRLQSNKNIALYKPVYMVSNQSNEYELPINGNTYMHYATYAVDGIKNDKTAQAAGEYAWSLLIDLQSVSIIKRSVITFSPKSFPTHYAILNSIDGQNWKKLTERKITRGGTYYDDFSSSKARYIKIKSIKPDKPDMDGIQMSISEFELF